jgi:hypothetical protein
VVVEGAIDAGAGGLGVLDEIVEGTEEITERGRVASGIRGAPGGLGFPVDPLAGVVAGVIFGVSAELILYLDR